MEYKVYEWLYTRQQEPSIAYKTRVLTKRLVWYFIGARYRTKNHP